MRMVILAAGRGSRLAAESGGRPKQLLDVGGRTLLQRQLDLAALAGCEPLVVARPELAEDFRRTGVEVLVEEAPAGILGTLYHARTAVHGPFCWIAGDMLFTDPAPLAELAAEHLEGGGEASFFFCQTSRFKAKLRRGNPPAVFASREEGHPLSIPNFWLHSPRVFSYLAPEPDDGQHMLRLIAAGEPIRFREYTAPVFEIDTPDDLAAARRFYAG
jgi:NDP-sugar pyrophosphorylase family protein